jgi:hypothetical protein
MPRPCPSALLDDAVASIAAAAPADLPPTALILDSRAGHWSVASACAAADLTGWRAPAPTWAVVVTSNGAIRDPDTAAAGGEVRVTVGVERTGGTSGCLAVGPSRVRSAPDAGRLYDIMLRTLGLPTPAAPEGTERLLAVLWLDALRGAPAPLDWDAAMAHHPAVRLLRAQGTRLDPTELAAVIDAAAPTWSWEVLRAAEAADTGTSAFCPAGIAAWSDAGSYARLVLADVPAIDPVWRSTRAHLTSAADRRMQDVLHRQGLLGGNVAMAG